MTVYLISSRDNINRPISSCGRINCPMSYRGRFNWPNSYRDRFNWHIYYLISHRDRSKLSMPSFPSETGMSMNQSRCSGWFPGFYRSGLIKKSISRALYEYRMSRARHQQRQCQQTLGDVGSLLDRGGGWTQGGAAGHQPADRKVDRVPTKLWTQGGAAISRLTARWTVSLPSSGHREEQPSSS